MAAKTSDGEGLAYVRAQRGQSDQGEGGPGRKGDRGVGTGGAEAL